MDNPNTPYATQLLKYHSASRDSTHRLRQMIQDASRELPALSSGAVGMIVYIGQSKLARGYINTHAHTPMIIAPSFDSTVYASRYTFQRAHISGRRVSDTGSLLGSQRHDTLLARSMMYAPHMVAQERFTYSNHTISLQVAFDTTEGPIPDEAALNAFLRRIRSLIDEPAATLTRSIDNYRDYDALFNVHHEPTVPNAIIAAFDITNSSSMSSLTMRHIQTDCFDTYEQLHLDRTIRKLQDNGDSRLYARALTKSEIRRWLTDHEYTPSDIVEFITGLKRNYTDFIHSTHVTHQALHNSEPYRDQHPLRIAVRTAWLDPVGETLTGRKIWDMYNFLDNLSYSQ